MALFNWLGGTGPYTAARLWSPRGAPGAGDTAAGRISLGAYEGIARAPAP